MRESTKVQKKVKKNGQILFAFFPWVWERERWKGRESKWPVVVQAGGRKQAYKLGSRNLTEAQRGKETRLKKKRKEKLHGLLKELAKKIVFLKMAVKLGFVQIKINLSKKMSAHWGQSLVWGKAKL